MQFKYENIDQKEYLTKLFDLLLLPLKFEEKL